MPIWYEAQGLMRRAALLALALWLAGCAPGTDPGSPTLPAAPDAVEQLTSRLAADVGADPPGWPSRSDYELVVLPFYDDTPESLDDALAGFDHYAAVYVASECLAGREPTPAGFREMVGRTFSAGSDRIPRIASEAETVIAAILAHDPQHAPTPCLRPYVTPATAVEAIAALRLTRPIIAANRPDLLPWQIDARAREIALTWFGRPVPLYQWACSHDHTCKLLDPP